MESSSSSENERGAAASPRIRVMLVDDSAVIRGLISRTLEKDSSIEIVSSLSNGEMAVNAIGRADPDVVILDIEMPIMTGIEAIPLLLKQKPDVKILMCSTLSLRGADITMKALALGATECIGKPTTSTEIAAAGGFSEELLRVVKGLGQARIARGKTKPQDETDKKRPPSSFYRTTKPVPDSKPDAPAPFKLRHDPLAHAGKPDVLVIGSSTGGPQALLSLMKNINKLDIPIVITQHMPKTFTAVLAKHITQHCGLPCHEGAEGMLLEKGNAYVAPGGFHMIICKRDDGHAFIHVDDGPPENYCKPSVDPMLRSVINVFGKKILAVILTGMGSDGRESCKILAEQGGRVIAQDKETSVVWGMPGAVAEAGLCTAVLPLNEIGPWVHNAVMGERKRMGQ